MNNFVKIAILLAASAGLFALQDFNFIQFKISACSYYQFNNNCANFNEFAFNKITRALVNLLLILIADKALLRLFNNKAFIYLTGILILMVCMYLFLSLNNNSMSLKINNILNTLLFSPLLLLVYFANFIHKTVK